MQKLLSIEEINNLEKHECEEKFKNVVELWPQAAQEVSSYLPFPSANQLINKFYDYLENSSESVKEQILCSYPHLAGKVTQEVLSAESANEHIKAGLNTLTNQQRNELQQLNNKFKDKFGFHFVVCVRVANKIEKILEGLRARLPNDKPSELKTSIDEVKKICKIRICDMIQYSSE